MTVVPASRIAVVIPCFRVREHILGVLEKMGPEVERVFVIDDCCPESSGAHVLDCCADPRVTVLRTPRNLGVGGAVKLGYQHALQIGVDIIVKVDGDGQMDPQLIARFVHPIATGQADYTKGNRFYDLENLRLMPRQRVFGNAALSILAKLSTGYWDIFDATNGYTAIHARVAARLPLQRISDSYFFETDMLFRLNTFRAVVVDVPMESVYGSEQSSLAPRSIIREFMRKHLINFHKRVFYNYFLRDMTIASLELPLGLLLILTGLGYGICKWLEASSLGTFASAGTVMLSTLPILTGLQFVLAFFNYDIAQVPRRAIHPLLPAPGSDSALASTPQGSLP